MIGDLVFVSGYITKDKFLVGRPLSQIGRDLGIGANRLTKGATFVKLNRLPMPNGFETAAYSITAEHRYQPQSGLDMNRLKRLAYESWKLGGLERLVKVRPTIRHDPEQGLDLQYPIGTGVPQWKILHESPIERHHHRETRQPRADLHAIALSATDWRHSIAPHPLVPFAMGSEYLSSRSHGK